MPINPPVIKSYSTPYSIIKILDTSKFNLLIVRNKIIAMTYGCEIKKKR